MTEKSEILSRISPAYKALYDLQTDVRAAKRWYNVLMGKHREPIDNLNSAQKIGDAYLERFYEIYEELRTGRSQFDKRVNIEGIEKKFDREYLSAEQQTFIVNAFKTFAESLFDATGNAQKEVNLADTLSR